MSDKNWLAYNDLLHYDTRIKEYIKNKDDSIRADVYSKDEIDQKLQSLDSINNIDERVDALEETNAATSATLISYREELDDIEANLVRLEQADIEITKTISNLKSELKEDIEINTGLINDQLNDKLDKQVYEEDKNSFVSKADLETITSIMYGEF